MEVFISSKQELQSDLIVRAEAAPWEQLGPGLQRQLLVYGADLMLVRVRFTKGAIGALHHHPHRQATYVAAGRFEVTVGDQKQILETGDAFFVRADVPHGVLALESGILIDTFTPARLDFVGGQSPESSPVQSASQSE